MYRKINLFFGLCLVTYCCFAQENQSKKTQASAGTIHEFRYTNPIIRDTAISMRDHFIIKVRNKWYCVGTSNPVWTGLNPGVRLLVSEDLVHWQQYSWLIDAGKLPAGCPYNGRFWAPERLRQMIPKG
jgi:xylan 1,4-beta-xylosidase